MAWIVIMTARSIENWRAANAIIWWSMFCCKRLGPGLTLCFFGVYRGCGQHKSHQVHAKLYDCGKIQCLLDHTKNAVLDLRSKMALIRVRSSVPDDIK